jgi:hypothetical protein
MAETARIIETTLDIIDSTAIISINTITCYSLYSCNPQIPP